MNDVKILMLGTLFLVLLFVAGLLAMFYIVQRFNKIVQSNDLAIAQLKKENEYIIKLVRDNMKEILNTLKDK